MSSWIMCVVVTFDISTLVIVDFIYYRRFCFTCRQHSFIVLVECGKKGQSEEQETFFSTKTRTFRPRKIRQALTDAPPVLIYSKCFGFWPKFWAKFVYYTLLYLQFGICLPCGLWLNFRSEVTGAARGGREGRERRGERGSRLVNRSKAWKRESSSSDARLEGRRGWCTVTDWNFNWITKPISLFQKSFFEEKALVFLKAQ